ncbi:hypothetical protein [Bradyrhizobium sp. SYSU BS000235]|uniref:hypothetical protein n=1 Tax=Bradyrhizobium sp. SYSU BS000235 TaxID=3411332 RepID=UPI003C795B6A
MSTTSRHVVLGLGLAGLLIDAVISHPAFAVNRVTLFKVTTPKQEIVIGLTAKELKQLTGKDAGSVEKALHEKGALDAWQYSTRRGASGEMEQAPVRHIKLASSDDTHVEAFSTKLKVVPISAGRIDGTAGSSSLQQPTAVN